MSAPRGLAGGFWIFQRVDEEPFEDGFEWYWGGDDPVMPAWVILHDVEFDGPTAVIARWMEPKYTRVEMWGRICVPGEEDDEGYRRCIYCTQSKYRGWWDQGPHECPNRAM